MLAVRNGVKSIIRAPGKAVLFTLVLAAVCAILVLSLAVFGAVRGYLKDCDSYYSTIVEAEYIGRDYPRPDVYDESAVKAVSEHRAELNALISVPGVRGFEPASNMLALCSGVTRADWNVHDPDAAVLKLHISNEYEDMYSAMVDESLYSRKDYSGKLILLRAVEDEVGAPFTIEAGGDYIITGRYFSGPNSYTWFKAEPIEATVNDGQILLPAVSEVSSADIEAYTEAARITAALNDTAELWKTSDIESLKGFNQQEMGLDRGRFFTEEEYASSSRVCIVTSACAAVFGLDVGSKAPLSVIGPDQNVYALLSDPIPESLEYEVVGVVKCTDQRTYRVFIPAPADPSPSFTPVTGYRLGTFTVKNGSGEELIKAAAPLSEYGFRFTLYDQGYSAATVPLRELYVITVLFLAAGLILAAAALLLQGHVFVSRQEEPARIMLGMGSGKAHVFGYFISSAAAAAIPAALIGVGAARLLEGRALELIRGFASRHAAEDLRFSSAGRALRKVLEFAPTVKPITYVLAALILVLGAVLAAAAFTLLVCSKAESGAAPRRRVKTRRHTRPAKSSRMSCMLKYGLLSVKRGGLRSAVSLILALAAAFFFFRTSYSLHENQVKLEAFVRDSVISGHATNPTGILVEGLSINPEKVAEVDSAGVFTSSSKNGLLGSIRFLGVCKTAEGEEVEVPEPDVPEGSFAMETFVAGLAMEPRWIKTDSIESNPVFFYTGVGEVEYLEGVPRDIFSAPGSEAAGIYEKNLRTYYNEIIPASAGGELDPCEVCALSARYMQKHGVKLGDTVRFFYLSQLYGMAFSSIDLLVAAKYVSPSEEDVIFSPACVEGACYNEVFELPIDGNLDSFTFTVGDTSSLTAVRDALENAGFHSFGSGERSTEYAILYDENYNQTVSSMQRQIEYVRILYGFLYALALIAGFAAAWLLISSRRREIALQLALGSGRMRTAANFIAEQLILVILGLALGCGICALLGESMEPRPFIFTAAFLGAWLLGTCTGLVSTLTRRDAAAISEPE